MSVNDLLVRSVKARAADTNNVVPFDPLAMSILAQAVIDFPLAPDEYIDVGRLPATVVNLQTLISYLKSIQTKLATRDPKVKVEEWEVAKTGQLKLYKLYVCAIHAMHSYAYGSPDYKVTPAVFCNAVAAWARNKPPAGLGKNGSTLWNKTFTDVSGRVLAVLQSLLYFCELMTPGRYTSMLSPGYSALSAVIPPVVPPPPAAPTITQTNQTQQPVTPTIPQTNQTQQSGIIPPPLGDIPEGNENVKDPDGNEDGDEQKDDE